MKSRCYNPATLYYSDYGGRGIRVCRSWRDNYESFRSWALSHGYQPGLVIDRVDNNGPYSPVNCHWVTHKASALNRRSNVLLTAWGLTKPLSEWSADDRCAVADATLHRLDRAQDGQDVFMLIAGEQTVL